jgi:hypothetical protein
VPRGPIVASSRSVARAVASGALAILVALCLAACGSSGGGAPASHGGAATASQAQRRCAAVAAKTLGEVAKRIYRQAAGGRGVAEAVSRVSRSPALAAAISSGDAQATRTALNGLLANQIARIEILKGGRVFAGAGAGRAIAPVRGAIPGTEATYLLSVQADSSYLNVARQVTGAEVVLLSGHGSSGQPLAATLAGGLPARIPRRGTIEYKNSRYATFSLSGSVYPAGPLHIALLVSTADAHCAGTTAQTRVATLGAVGERIYAEEEHSPYVLETLRRIEADPALQRAVAARDIAATRAAIIGLFAAHIHVVRVRVNVAEPSGAQRFFYDLGGPYVLAPVRGTLRRAGKLVGHISFAIQDDAGYMKLAHRFTGAEVLMRSGSRQIMGTLTPGPADVPEHGAVSYRGQTYQAYSFSGVAFPSGPLRISLLIGRRRAIEG